MSGGDDEDERRPAFPLGLSVPLDGSPPGEREPRTPQSPTPRRASSPGGRRAASAPAFPALRGGSLVRPATYEVGYGRPPAQHRFQPGQSGNPKGRPRGSGGKGGGGGRGGGAAGSGPPALHEERLKQIVLEEAYRTITVRDGERTLTVPMAQAVVRAMAVNAAKGQHRAQKLFAEMLAATEAAHRRLHDEWLTAAIGYKVDWERELSRRERLGLTHLPPPLPHPDDVVVDIRRGTAHIAGPATREELAERDRWRAQAKELERNIALLRRHLKREADPDERADIERHLKIGEDTLARIRKAVGG